MSTSTEIDNGLPLDMTIFGGMGDLAMRKLLPALYMAYLHGNQPASTRILSTGRQDYDRAAYLAFIEEHSKLRETRAEALRQSMCALRAAACLLTLTGLQHAHSN